VDDIAATRHRLAANNVTVSEVYEFPPCFACFAKDPDGNNFALHQRK
jgi:predicted enzyme related to lactoylglutathione lyase